MAEPHEVNASIAMQLGVPRQAITVVAQASGSTATEAEAVVRYVRKEDWRCVIVVTSKLHTRRAGWIYRTLVPDNVEVIMRPSRYDPFDDTEWWHSRTFTRRVVIEYQKLVVFAFRDSWRSHPRDAEIEVEALPTPARIRGGDRPAERIEVDGVSGN
jgi:hypothetical protein